MDTDRLDIVTKLEWAIDTIKSQLLFGRDDLGAAKARELRAKGVMLDAVDHIKQLEQKLSDSEADWIKMRDIAEETQRKLDEAIEVIRFYTIELPDHDAEVLGFPDGEAPTANSMMWKKARDLLAKIEGKKD